MSDIVLPSGVVYIVIAWSFTTFALYISLLVVNLRRSKKVQRLVENLWNEKVELLDLNGEVIKVPVTRLKGEDEDGNPVYETEMVVAPLWYTIMFSAGTVAVTHFKAWFNNQKSHMSKRLGKEALKDMAEGEGDAMTLLSVLPAKWQKVIAGGMLLKRMGDGHGGKPRGPGKADSGEK